MYNSLKQIKIVQIKSTYTILLLFLGMVSYVPFQNILPRAIVSKFASVFM